MIDWDSDPKPDFTPPQNLREIRTIEEALKLLDEWREAYDELRREYVKTHAALIDARFMASAGQSLADNFEALYRAALDLDPLDKDLRDKLRASLVNYKP